MTRLNRFQPGRSRRQPRLVTIIPARANSKGLAGKNILPLRGRPLISYSIEVARRVGCIDSVIVSTESAEIARVAEEWGAEVPFLRPEKYAGDTALLGDVIQFTLKELQRRGQRVDGYLTLLPTSPFRTVSMICDLAHKLANGYSSIMTVCKVKNDAYVSLDGDTLRFLGSDYHQKEVAGKVFYKSIGLVTGGLLNNAGKHYYYVIDDPISLIDIDTIDDFMCADMVLREELFNFEFPMHSVD